MVRDFKHPKSHRKHTSKKYRKLSSSDDERNKSPLKHHSCACCDDDEPEALTLPTTTPATNSGLRKRMISIMGPSVLNNNLATILSTDTSELCRKSFTEPRRPKKKCSKLVATTVKTPGRHCSKHQLKPQQRQRSNSCSRINSKSPSPARNNNCRKKVRHQCTKPPDMPPTNIPKCPGCTKEFKSPILLCCGHTLCKRCVTTFVGESDGTAFKCPSCETEIKLTGGEEELFCPNFIILRQTEFGEEEENQDLVCAVCESDYEADFYCDTCRDLLCHNCADAHQIVKYTRDHRIRDIDCSTDVSSLVKKRYYCADHEEEVVDTYCVPCQKCVCLKCAHLYHRSSNHHCLPVSTAAKNVREEIRRQLYEFKSRSPNLQLALMDLQKAKQNLREQANVTYTEISESVARLIASVKEQEKKLHKKLEDACQTKVSALKAKKRKIVFQLERFDSFGTILQQLDDHGNNIETLQMRSAIRSCANFLEKNPCAAVPSGPLQSSIFFNSNEVKIKREIDKHGEIYHFTSGSDDNRCPLVNPKTDNNNKNGCCYHIVSNFEDSVSVMTLLEPTSDLALRKNAKRIRAKSNWMILKSRLSDILKIVATTGRSPCVPSRNKTSKRSVHRKEMSRARRQKARANWMILRSHIGDLTTDSDTYLDDLNKNRRKATRKKYVAGVLRARANWMLIRSRIPDIILYGKYQRYSTKRGFSTKSSEKEYARPSRHHHQHEDHNNLHSLPARVKDKSLVGFSSAFAPAASSPMKLPVYKDVKRVSKNRRGEEGEKRRNKHHHRRLSKKVNKSPRSTLSRKKRITQTALENWSQLIEHAQQQLPSKQKQTNNKDRQAIYKSWDDLLKGEIKNPQGKKSNAKVGGKPSSVLHKAKNNDDAFNHWDNLTNNTATGDKQHRPNNDKAHLNWDHLTKYTATGEKQHRPKNDKANQNWDHLTKNTATGEKQHRPKNDKANQNWDHLTKNTATGGKQHRPKNDKAHQNWDHLTKNTSTGEKQQRPKNNKANQDWDQLTKNTVIEEKQHGPNKTLAYQHWDYLTNNTQSSSNKQPYRNWDVLVQNTAREIKQTSSLRSHDAFMNWDNLMRSKTLDPKKSYKEWDHLIAATSTLSPLHHAKSDDTLSRHHSDDPQSLKHWHHLLDSAKKEKSDAQENWRQLTGNSHHEKETADRHWTELVRSIKTNNSNSNRRSKKNKNKKQSEKRAKKGWDNIRTSLGRNLTPQMDDSQPVIHPAHQERAYKNWWALASSSENGLSQQLVQGKTAKEDDDIREKAVRNKHRVSDAIQNWNTLLKGTFNCKRKFGCSFLDNFNQILFFPNISRSYRRDNLK